MNVIREKEDLQALMRNKNLDHENKEIKRESQKLLNIKKELDKKGRGLSE